MHFILSSWILLHKSQVCWVFIGYCLSFHHCCVAAVVDLLPSVVQKDLGPITNTPDTLGLQVPETDSTGRVARQVDFIILTEATTTPHKAGKHQSNDLTDYNVGFGILPCLASFSEKQLNSTLVFLHTWLDLPNLSFITSVTFNTNFQTCNSLCKTANYEKPWVQAMSCIVLPPSLVRSYFPLAYRLHSEY